MGHRGDCRMIGFWPSISVFYYHYMVHSVGWHVGHRVECHVGHRVGWPVEESAKSNKQMVGYHIG